VDLKAGFIRLRPEDTKTERGRSIRVHPELMRVLKGVLKVRSIEDDRVFHRKGGPVTGSAVREAHEFTCKKAEIDDFHFHDFRHTCINNWRKHGHDYFKIMAASGTRTISVFKRYNMVDEAELRTLVESQENNNLNMGGTDSPSKENADESKAAESSSAAIV